jgi:hypothetical protein
MLRRHEGHLQGEHDSLKKGKTLFTQRLNLAITCVATNVVSLIKGEEIFHLLPLFLIYHLFINL